MRGDVLVIQTHKCEGQKTLKHLLIHKLFQEPCAAGYTSKVAVHSTCLVLKKIVFEVKNRNRRNLRYCTKPDNIASKELRLVGTQTQN